FVMVFDPVVLRLLGRLDLGRVAQDVLALDDVGHNRSPGGAQCLTPDAASRIHVATSRLRLPRAPGARVTATVIGSAPVRPCGFGPVLPPSCWSRRSSSSHSRAGSYGLPPRRGRRDTSRLRWTGARRAAGCT